jgi:glycosyltransferase involved in cell wall biosynthesis
MDAPAFLYSVPLGAGGLGMQAATALHGLLSLGSPVSAIGPGQLRWPFESDLAKVRWMSLDAPAAARARIFQGRAQYRRDCEYGRRLAASLRSLKPRACYGFTQISREAAAWCNDNGIPFILDNPNSHIRHFRAVYQRESLRWCSFPFQGHPTEAMVERVEEEYSLATRIRVSSSYSKKVMVLAGVPAHKIEIIPQCLDLKRFMRPAGQGFPKPAGKLRVCFVGSLDLRKGFVYLLRAIRKVGADKISLRIAGNTGDPWCRRLFARESKGLDVELMPGDPVPVYHWAELSIAPSLEDGFGFVILEAMASGVPVIASDQCGGAEWIAHDATGWIVPFGNEPPAGPRAGVLREDLIAQYLQLALDNRTRLAGMGEAAMKIAFDRGQERNASQLADWFYLNTLVTQ